MEQCVKKKEKKEDAENPFNRLPDDVVVNIFDRLSHIECLCRCFVVSKRFSSLVPRVQTVSVNRILANKGLRCKLLSKASPTGRLNVPGLAFLPALPRIRSLNLEIISAFEKGNSDSVFKWGANFTTKHNSVTYLYAKSLSKMTGAEEEEEEEDEKWGDEISLGGERFGS